ncbi:hypothetical protein HDV02_002130 [Globomyces sp. JEL0801]|nr:hypothetical protein HDV02_002130 [Globomyces sp. JEL0801]
MIKRLGSTLAWGNNLHCQMGIGPASHLLSKPVPVLKLQSEKGYVPELKGGALTVFGIGEDDSEFYETPELLSFNVENVSFTKVSTGDFHTLALTEDGVVYSWGAGLLGRNGELYDSELHPIPTLKEHKVIDIGAKGNTSYAIIEQNGIKHIQIWGFFANKKSLLPIPLKSSNSILKWNEIISIDIANNSIAIYGISIDQTQPALMVLEEGDYDPAYYPYCPHYNEQLKTTEEFNLPIRYNHTNNSNLKQIALCDNHLLVLDGDGKISINALGKLNASLEQFKSPQGIDGPIQEMKFGRNSAILISNNDIFTFTAIPPVPPAPAGNWFYKSFIESKADDSQDPRTLVDTMTSTDAVLVGHYPNLNAFECGWDHFLIYSK